MANVSDKASQTIICTSTADDAISNLPMASSSQPNRASDRDIEKQQTDDVSLYAELGTEGVHVSENANEGMKVGSRVNDNELRLPYAIIN